MSGRFRDLIELQVAYQTADDPLHSFYIPVLSRALRMDRASGYFTSGSLVVAAEGLAHLIASGGTMRLQVGAKLDAEDVEAIRTGATLEEVASERLIGLLQEPADDLRRKRLEALAWMVANGTLDIRVVLPRGDDNLPIPAPQADEYYHPKNGVLVDAENDRVAFSGSINETVQGWEKNYESFLVFRSWDEGQLLYLRQIERQFEQVWSGQHPDWISIPIPEAVRLELLKFTPAEAPQADPLEVPAPPPFEPPVGPSAEERILAAFLRDVPYLLSNGGNGMSATAGIKPWPHQLRVADRATATFSERYLLADEVGLGKTIEAGLILRDLILSGSVSRCLILAPASVLRQWQDELKEKFSLDVPFLDGTKLVWPGPDHVEEHIAVETVWTAAPVMLASSQNAKRKDRRADLLKAGSWDLVVVDEAHHARRKDFLDMSQRRPNRLLELLEGVDGQTGLAQQTRGLLLLTATPMQVHAVEVWDLLMQLGLAGRWGASEANFLRYFDEVRVAGQTWDRADWSFLAAMARDELEHGGSIDEDVTRAFETRLGVASWHTVSNFAWSDNPRSSAMNLSVEERSALLGLLRHLTPLRRRMFRHTRNLLRRYREKGLLPGKIADREPEPRWVDFTADEEALYRRVEDYISNFYKKYEGERKGLGFVMTVYRRRLTSSFYALQRSLEKRLAFLNGHAADVGLTDEDIEDDDLDDDITEELAAEGGEGALRGLFREEAEYVEGFLSDIQNLGSDTKFDQLVKDLDSALAKRDSVVMFTQYADTMDYLRDRLCDVYGTKLACYSGRGGEWWSGVAWAPVTKEEVKTAFAHGDVKILLGTDALAEGLNLQTCGVEINYDVPWNPMRLEQRIGRIDRIGQRYDTVWIWNYFFRDTIEAKVYQRLRDRIDWFKGVVGPLQPILYRVERAIKRVALEGGETRGAALDAEISELEREITETERQGIDLDDFVDVAEEPVASGPTVVTCEQIEAFILGSVSLGPRFQAHGEIEGAFVCRWEGADLAVTFRPDVADDYPDTLTFLTYGDPVLRGLLAAVPEPPLGNRVARVSVTEPDRPWIGWYAPVGHDFRAIAAFADARVAAAAMDEENAEWVDGAEQAFARDVSQQLEEEREQRIRQADGRVSALRERTRLVLARGTYLWAIRQGGGPGVTPATTQSMIFAEKYPWAPLSALAVELPSVSYSDPVCQELVQKNAKQLEGLWLSTRTDAEQLVHQLVKAVDVSAEAAANPPEVLLDVAVY
jgi:hypothetical protein